MAFINDRLMKNDLRCKHTDCIHAAKLGTQYVCNYLLDTKKKRPCKCTPDCTEYVRGKHEHKERFTNQAPDYWGQAKDYEV